MGKPARQQPSKLALVDRSRIEPGAEAQDAAAASAAAFDEPGAEPPEWAAERAAQEAADLAAAREARGEAPASLNPATGDDVLMERADGYITEVNRNSIDIMKAQGWKLAPKKAKPSKAPPPFVGG